MNLTKIRIIDFQSIADLTLKLGKFTVIVGDSDQGKTAVIRALHSVFTNPTGQGRVRYGADKLGVMLDFNNGLRIAYAKGQSSKYKLIGGTDSKKYNKVGRDVPPEVASLVRKWTASGTAVLIQIQGQKDSDFLVGEGGVRTERGMDSIDARVFRQAVTACDSTIRKLTLERGRVNKQLSHKRGKLDKLSEVDVLIRERAELRDLASALRTTLASESSRLETLTEVASSSIIYSLTSRIKELPTLPPVGAMIILHTCKNLDRIRVDDLEHDLAMIELILRAHDLGVQIWEAKTARKLVKMQLKNTDRELFLDGICPLCGRPLKEDSCEKGADSTRSASK